MIESEEEAQAFCAARCDEEAMFRLRQLAVMLAEENTRQNLVSHASLGSVWQRHIADSLQLLDYVPRETGLWLDLGTGAGFPGVAIALARPGTQIIAVESRRRRVEWLEHVCSTLGAANCRIFGAKLESMESLSASVISARAFAQLGKLFSLSARFSTHETLWLLPKGRSGAQELEKQSAAIRSMFHVEPSATDPTAGLIIGKGSPPTP